MTTKAAKQAKADAFSVDRQSWDWLVNRLLSVESALERAGRELRAANFDGRHRTPVSADAIVPGAGSESVRSRYAVFAPPQILAAIGLEASEPIPDDSWSLDSATGEPTPLRLCGSEVLCLRRDQALQDMIDNGPRGSMRLEDAALVRAINRTLGERRAA
jgi:hypothetical protein